MKKYINGCLEMILTFVVYYLFLGALTALWDDGYMDAESQQLRADISAVLAKARGE